MFSFNSASLGERGAQVEKWWRYYEPCGPYSEFYPRFKPINGRVITQIEMQNNCTILFLMGRPLTSGIQEAADLTYFVGQFKRQP